MVCVENGKELMMLVPVFEMCMYIYWHKLYMHCQVYQQITL